MKKGQQTKERIINVARTLFATKGFDMTRTNEIASACNVSEATIYKYFESKKDLLLATITPNEKEESEDGTSHLSTDDLVENHVCTMINKILENKEQFSILFRETQFDQDISKQYVDQIFKTNAKHVEIQKRIDSGEIHYISDIILFNVGIISFTLALSTHYEIHQQKKEPYFTAERIKSIAQLLVYGIHGKNNHT
ncbi:TetR/AcrR family transcriptional regulator [Peribacillus simplex]|uniref:TetR/AcrR family transcriptional regulator n=1 Tax=Peribacillus simplex TaxID=1478 RepID=A0AAW7IT85_9BACI|nr:TetR/AcrR family transcriptional regulator [Peribacillus simplex]MDM5294558.1 TetR/AcrR family transcriptional regulator [Peribacillus simplex]MDM5453508.1 TetR/AcrR family transcriptional regulator [Peribacillus simplex]